MIYGILQAIVCFILALVLEKLARKGKVSPLTVFFIAYATGVAGAIGYTVTAGC